MREWDVTTRTEWKEGTGRFLYTRRQVRRPSEAVLAVHTVQQRYRKAVEPELRWRLV